MPRTENGQAGRKGQVPRGDPPQNVELGGGPARTQAPATPMANSIEVWVVRPVSFGHKFYFLPKDWPPD